jgi:hypothetical protein
LKAQTDRKQAPAEKVDALLADDLLFRKLLHYCRRTSIFALTRRRTDGAGGFFGVGS